MAPPYQSLHPFSQRTLALQCVALTDEERTERVVFR